MSRNLFSYEKLERIYNAAIRVLGQMGMRVHNRQALEALEKFGAKLDYPNQCALFPPQVIDRMLENLVKIGAKVVKYARYVTFQLAEVLVSRSLFCEILERIHRLRPIPIESG